MAHVLFSCPMDSERRAVLAEKDAGDFEAVVLDDLPEAARAAACEVPMQVTRIGAEVAGIAATVAAAGNPSVRGDAITAGLLAAAGSRAAAALVRINLAGSAGSPGGAGSTGMAGDGRPAEAQHLAAEATRLAAEAERSVR